MNKMRKMLLLINVLQSRKRIDIKSITTLCNVHKRTAYRYINTISEANVPIYFDGCEGVYKLREEINQAIWNFDTQDIVMLQLALKTLIPIVNEDYANDLRDLLSRLCAVRNTGIDPIIDSGIHLDYGKSDNENTVKINELLIHLGILTKRRLRLHHDNNMKETQSITISDPQLQFKAGWIVVGITNSGVVKIPLTAIKHVKLL